MDFNYNNYNNDNMNFSTENSQMQNNMQTPPQPEPPKKKKSKVGAVIAGIMAIVIIGGASGFGGAYLGRVMTDSRENRDPYATTEGTSPSDENDDFDSIPATTTVPYERPETQIDDNLSELDNMVNDSYTDECTYAELYAKVSDTIVVVNNYQYISQNYYGYSASDSDENGGEIQLYGTGSGIVITTDGYIITNAHVIEGAAKISVAITDYNDPEQKNEYEAVLVGSDSSTDVAVLKVTRDEAFRAAALGDSDTCVVGQQVCAIGNPSNLEKTMTTGIISGLNRYYDKASNYELSSIQTDTAINPGNSGGGLFDMYGNVVGIVNAKIVSDSAENLGFAITINEAKPVISDLINFGYVTGRPVLGVTTLQLNEYTAYLYGFETTGLLITEINEDAPVAKSGLRIGDIIKQVNGIDVESVTDVQAILSEKKAGDKVMLEIIRTSESDRGNSRSETLEIEVELDENRG